jgi:hypothetical protein
MADNEKNPEKVIKEPGYRNWRVSSMRMFGGIVVALVIFGAGLAIGVFHRTDGRFTRMQSVSGAHHMRFGSSLGKYGMVGPLGVRSGVVAIISNVGTNSVTVNSSNGVSQEVLVSATTKILKSGNSIKISDLKSGEQITITGFINQSGQLQATVISTQ